jgi:hypothetical protein
MCDCPVFYASAVHLIRPDRGIPPVHLEGRSPLEPEGDRAGASELPIVADAEHIAFASSADAAHASCPSCTARLEDAEAEAAAIAGPQHVS